MAKRKIRFERPTEFTELLGETVWIGTDKQMEHHVCPEALVVGEHPAIRIKLDGFEDVISAKREELWIRSTL